jgi:S1-C subfamily serine protease
LFHKSFLSLKFSLCFVLFFSNASNALETFKYSLPEINAFGFLNNAKSTDFTSITDTKRSSGKNVFLKVVPSVVKILTNESSGSGIVISTADKGYILSNHHVVAGYNTVGVIFSNDNKNSDVSIGTVVKFDEVTDLALIELNAKRPGLSPIAISKLDISVGDDVHAVGHPLGEDWTYTRGYISQIRQNYSWQTAVSDHHVANVIQTQTPINPGNSGGPLVNNNGELVGINTFVSKQGQGLGYSVANSTIQKFLKTSGNVRRKVMSSENFGNLVHTEDKNKNGSPDLYYFDSSKNKVVDMYAFDENEDFYVERLVFDENENQVPELVIFDFKADNGQIVTLYEFDKDEDGKAEAIGIDYDRDGKIDKVMPNN